MMHPTRISLMPADIAPDLEEVLWAKRVFLLVDLPIL